MTKYVIKLGDFYLSNLFSDSIKETFSSKSIDDAYRWDIKEVADDVSNQYAGSEVNVITTTSTSTVILTEYQMKVINYAYLDLKASLDGAPDRENQQDTINIMVEQFPFLTQE